MLPKTTKTPDANIVKIAVEMSGKNPQLIEFDQRIPLVSIIQELCRSWDIFDPDNYELQFGETNNNNYVTQKNRSEVKNGSVLNMRYSAAKTSKDILACLKEGLNVEDKLKDLQPLSSDLTFASEFIKEKGLDMIIPLIETSTGNALKYSMLSFVELMNHGIISWDVLEYSFITTNIRFINTSGQNKDVVQSALSVLENIVQSSKKTAEIVEKDVTFDILFKLLQESTSPAVQQNTIALINALFVKAKDDKKKIIASTFISTKQYRTVIQSCIHSNIGAEMAHQLYILQTLTLGLLNDRIRAININSPEANEKVSELRKIAFEDSIECTPEITARRQTPFAAHFKKLGFRCDMNPVQDFLESPPGMLALDCMTYFARNYSQNYSKVVHENSCRADEHECPFGRTSIELVKVLCDILRIGEAPTEQGQDFHPMFFNHEHPFEEFYCICIVILNKTWKDMRATSEDFQKVFSVVREQITRSLAVKPKTLDEFRSKINDMSYAKITDLRQQERTSREECESTASAIVSLKKKITPEIMELIKQQRLGYLVEGTRFSKYSGGKRERDKFWYARLSQNHKVICYGDCDEKTIPDDLSGKLAITDISMLLVGKDCPHSKDVKTRKQTMNLVFSIAKEVESNEQPTLDFVAPDEMTFNYWTDGINALLNKEMKSPKMAEDFDTLLSMEIKLRLLDTEGVDISKDPPPIPPEPENYDFCFEG